MKKICGIYLIVSPSGRRYIGSSKDINRRWLGHKNRQDKKQTILYFSFKKYGAGNHSFTILFECKPEERLMWERIFGDLYLSLKDFGGLNTLLPGYEDTPQVFSEEQRLKIAQKQYAISMKPENIERMKSVAAKHLHSPEARKASSERLIERYKDSSKLEQQRQQAKIFQNTDEAKEANRQRAIERFKDPEKRAEAARKTREYFKNNPEAAKIHSERMKKTNANPWFHPQSQLVVNTISGQIFPSIREAAKDAKKDQQALSRRIKGVLPNNTHYVFLGQIKTAV